LRWWALRCGQNACSSLCHDTGAGQKFHIGGGVHGHHIDVQPVVDRTRLGAGAAVGLVDLDVFAGGLFVVRHKSGVVVFVKLTRHVVRGVEQVLSAGGQAGQGQGGGQCDVREFFHGDSV
jgi:hypothetical protein